MCGITGFVGPIDERSIERMTASLAHRGPDGCGIWVDRNSGVHFGHRRLAIVDVEGGHQPMWNEDETVGVVFNGQIYNHLELREALTRRGHKFVTSHSDTEVLVHGYEEWGTTIAERLNGMFAFAIVDRRRQQLYLARDRFGEKPLFWSRIGREFAFASELSALALHPRVSRSIDIRVLQKFFAHGFIPAPNALLEGVQKVRPGSWLRYDLANGELEECTYWQFRIQPDESLGPDAEPRLVDELREHLRESVRRRLMSDVPLGIFLSGGVDSSAVLALARDLLPATEIKTFNIGFTEASFDESEYAARVAACFEASHYCEILDLNSAQKLVPEVLARLDEPIGDASIIPTFLVSQFTRQKVTVALSGDGGDELFAGYDPFAALAAAQIYSRLVPSPLHRGMRCLAELMPRSERNMSFDFKVRRALLGLSYPERLWSPVWLSPMSPELIREAFQSPLSADDLYAEVIADWEASDKLNTIDKTLQFFTNFYLKDNILVKSDRASMLNSLESRAVFLDNDLVDFARRLPSHFKYRSGKRKYILKKALRGIVPNFVLERPKKGFGIPLQAWLRDLSPKRTHATPGVSAAYMTELAGNQSEGRTDNRLAAWSWLTFQAFMSARDKAA